jgi:hypothetical protein
MSPRILTFTLVFSGAMVLFAPGQPARAQGIGQNLDFGALETGVLPNGTELPDLTGDTLDPNSPPPPKRAEALPPPSGFFDAPDAPASKKKARKPQR